MIRTTPRRHLQPRIALAAGRPRPAGRAAPRRQPRCRAVEVVGTTPVPGTGVPKDQIPSNVQTANDKRLRQLQSLNLPDFMASQLPSVNVNEIQGNPYQMDVNYRGFTASPLLGTPQGLSVFLDGVRVNEPFGDVVNWDLIPRGALASLTLLPGSNPLFGLNTLGGALVAADQERRHASGHRGRAAGRLVRAHRRRADARPQARRQRPPVPRRQHASTKTAGATTRRREIAPAVRQGRPARRRAGPGT